MNSGEIIHVDNFRDLRAQEMLKSYNLPVGRIVPGVLLVLDHSNGYVPNQGSKVDLDAMVRSLVCATAVELERVIRGGAPFSIIYAGRDYKPRQGIVLDPKNIFATFPACDISTAEGRAHAYEAMINEISS